MFNAIGKNDLSPAVTAGDLFSEGLLEGYVPNSQHKRSFPWAPHSGRDAIIQIGTSSMMPNAGPVLQRK